MKKASSRKKPAKPSAKAKAKKPKAPKGRSRRRTAIMRHSREGMRAPGSEAKRFYLERLLREVPTTLRVMRALPAGSADFQPHEKSRRALSLVHVFVAENWAALQATKGEIPMPPQVPPAAPSLEDEIDAYERGVALLAAAVERMPDSRLAETVTFTTGPGQTGPMPVVDVLWYMLMDSIHHRGQLSVYVRQAGGRVPSIYGPTADEPWR